ncbi:MAG: GNAT family N-acetyltransferase [Lachnospiraceae bacterium]
MPWLPDNIKIRMSDKEDWEKALNLAWETFLIFEAKDYGKEGIDNFRNFISDQSLKKLFLLGKYQMIVAYVEGKIVGMITWRNRNHISLLFVDQKYHRMGIGTQLILELKKYLRKKQNLDYVTVNAAPYGIDFYHKIGFIDTGTEKNMDGIRYTPMILNFF